MADNHSPSVRSYNMSRIKSKDTKPELAVRKYLFSKGFRYRIHDKRLPGKPDLVLPKYKTVIFVHGCFWHNHDGCRRAVIPKSRVDYWLPKIVRNKSRDAENTEKLKASGWKVLTLFECELKPKNVAETLESLLDQIKESVGKG
ncbi:very short patch repair endonuclease [Spirosoma flavus]